MRHIGLKFARTVASTMGLGFVIALNLVSFELALAQAADKEVTLPDTPPITPLPAPPAAPPQTSDIPATDPAPPKISLVSRSLTPYSVLAHFSLLDSWVPMKWGASIVWNKSSSSSFELEYTRGKFALGAWSIDLGNVSEDRWSADWRYFGSRNSLYYLAGINYSRLTATLGNDYLASIPGLNRAAYEAMEIRTLGLDLGLGNRWQTTGGIVYGFDWLVIHMPLILVEERAPFLEKTNSAAFRNEVEDGMKYFRKIPSFSVAKVQFGMSF